MNTPLKNIFGGIVANLGLIILLVNFVLTISGIIFLNWDIVHIYIIFCADVLLNTLFVAIKYGKDELTLFKNFRVFNISKSRFSFYTSIITFLLVRIGLLCVFFIVCLILILITANKGVLIILEQDFKKIIFFEDIHFCLAILLMIVKKGVDFVDYYKDSKFDLIENRIRLEEYYIDDKSYVIMVFILFGSLVDMVAINLIPSITFSIFTSVSCLFIMIKTYYDIRALFS